LPFLRILGRIVSQMSEDEQFRQGSALPRRASHAGPAIRDRCRAARIGDVPDFAECLVKARGPCKHGFSFGNRNYCAHPQRELIIARTLTAEGPPGQ
jgi:hypothetical protein